MYTIVILKGGEAKRNRVMAYFRERLVKEGKYTAELSYAHDKGMPSIHVQRVRLTKAKPYCGQHPGECVIKPHLRLQKKKVGKWLEWDDWVKFHAFVNRVLNRFKTHADVWSNPQDIRGKMWVRKGLKPRIKWEWENIYNSYGRVQVWNNGTFDQFLSEAA